MKRTLPRPELLELFRRVIQIRLPGTHVTFTFAEENDTHVEAGIFNVPGHLMDESETYAYTIADALTQGSNVMITPILRDVETTHSFYPKFAQPPGTKPEEGESAAPWLESGLIEEERFLAQADHCQASMRSAANEELALAA